MKKLATLVFALLLGASLSFAQAGTGTAPTSDTSKPAETGKKHKGGKKGHKGGKKSKKAASDAGAAPAPK